MGHTPTDEDGVEADSWRQSLARAWLKVGDDPDLWVPCGNETERGEGSVCLGFGLVGPTCWAARGEGALALWNGSEDWAG